MLREALNRLHQADKFKQYWSYFQSEWISSVEDLQLAVANENTWSQFHIPLRLKVEIALLLSSSHDAEPEVASEAVEDCEQAPEEDPWETFFCEEYQTYYHFNHVTGESVWATEDASLYPETSAAGDDVDAPQSQGFVRPRQIPSRSSVEQEAGTLAGENRTRSDSNSSGSSNSSGDLSKDVAIRWRRQSPIEEELPSEPSLSASPAMSDVSEHFIITEKPDHRMEFEVETYLVNKSSPLPMGSDSSPELQAGPFFESTVSITPTAPPMTMEVENQVGWVVPMLDSPMNCWLEEKSVSESASAYARTQPLDAGADCAVMFPSADLRELAFSSPLPTAVPVLPSELTSFSPQHPSQRYPVHVKPSGDSIGTGQRKAKRFFNRINIFGKKAQPPLPPAPPRAVAKSVAKQQKLDRLVEMGFTMEAAEYALQLSNGDLGEASAMLLEAVEPEPAVGVT